jgi:putative ABC transport system substrate-binding protein
MSGEEAMARNARRSFLVTVAAFIAAQVARAQDATKLRRIGVLWPTSDSPTLDAFRRGLRDLGYIEGQNIAVDYRYSHGKDELLPGLAADLVRLDVEVILTYGVTAARAVTKATTTIPVVNGSMSDPVAAGLVVSLARPGGNLTGLTSRSPELTVKRLEMIKEVVPGMSRLAVLTTAGRTATLASKEAELAAQSAGIAIQTFQVRRPEDFENAFSAMARDRVEALIVVPDLMFNQNLKQLVGLAHKYRFPAVYYSKDFVEAGGLMSYASSFNDQFRRAATYVDKILKGANPGDLPIEAPTKLEFAINLKTARMLGLTLSQAILLRSDSVIE